MTAIVDYGVGNLFSLRSSLAAIGEEAEVTGDARRIAAADRVILPGVGAFADARRKLAETGMDEAVLAAAEGGKPLLGICLGMQLLFDRGEEVRPCPGQGLVHGAVKKIETPYKLPHIGWNTLTFPGESPLFRGLDEGASVYFVHSYCALADDPADVIAWTDYGAPVTAAVNHGLVYGCQFHPEKSGEVGLTILKNFGGLSR